MVLMMGSPASSSSGVGVVQLPSFAAARQKKAASSNVEGRPEASGRRGRKASTGASARATAVSCFTSTSSWRKSVWVLTKNKQVMTTAVEGGWTTFIFTPDNRELADEWASIARIEALFLADGEICDMENNRVALFEQISSGDQLHELKSLIGQADTIVMDPLDWQIIPAENMLAAFQGSNTSVFATAKTAAEARLFLEALEKGMDGIVLQTDNPSEVFALKEYFALKLESSFKLSDAIVTRLEPVGTGDRVCVDLCSLLTPGEGLLVGSFARGLFLVHSECLESSYIASRPFRVNAGPVHAYVASPGGRTSYLSELKSGDEVMVVNSEGRARNAIVGRVKIESRPLILVEAETPGKDFKGSLLLQNAETVCLVQPPLEEMGRTNLSGALPVSKLQVGDRVLVCVQEGARHTGVKIQEFILEK